MQSYFAPSPNPIIIKGLRRGNNQIMIRQEPKYSDSIPILRSNNESGGLEFTWNTWLFLETVDDRYSHIFHKGDATLNNQNISPLNNSPGLYVKRNPIKREAELRIIMSTFDNPMGADITIPNIPLQKIYSEKKPIKSFTREMLNHIKENRSVALMIDQRVTEGIRCNFFYEPALTTTIPAQIVKKYDFEIVPVHIERYDEYRFNLNIEKPLKFNENASIEEITNELNKILEKMILKNPSQWILTHNRWK